MGVGGWALPVVHSPRHRLHDPQVELESSGLLSPRERPERLESIMAALRGGDLPIEEVSPSEHGQAPLTAVHDPGLVAFLAHAWERYQQEVREVREVVPDVFAMAGLRRGMGPAPGSATVAAELGQWCFETTTPLVEGTYAAARAAVDVALTATDLVLAGHPLAYAACRPPGHHATSTLYGGYCFFNNAAIAAAYASATAGMTVSVLDVDYHHGNGTQEIFFERSDVQVVSLHGDPVRAYPFHTGFAGETGWGAGAGWTRNIPLPAGLTDDAYLAALDEALTVVDRADPGLIVVSLGCDTAATDPLGDLALTTAGFHALGCRIAALGRPLVVVQEGGYDIDRLGEYAGAVLAGAADRHTRGPR